MPDTAVKPRARAVHKALALHASCTTSTRCSQFYDYQEPTIGASFLQQSITLDYATIKFEVRCGSTGSQCCANALMVPWRMPACARAARLSPFP